MDSTHISQQRPILPFDVFEQIIDIPGNDLVSLSLVCRLFAHLCRKQRFRKVEITDLPPAYYSFLRGSSRYQRTALSALLKERPDLTRFVRKLHVYGRGGGGGKLIEEVFKLNLSQLRISGFEYAEMTRTAKFGLGHLLDHYISLGNIRSLILSDVQHIPILDILSCPNITELQMDHCTFTEDWKAHTSALVRVVQRGIRVKKLVLSEGRGSADKARLFNPLYFYCSELEEIDTSFFATGPKKRSRLTRSALQQGVGVDETIVDPAPRVLPRGFPKLHTIKSRGWVDWNVLCQLTDKFGIEAFPSLKTAYFRMGDLADSSYKDETKYIPRKIDYQGCFSTVFQHVNTLENLNISILGETNLNIDFHSCIVNNAHSLRNISLSWENPHYELHDTFLRLLCNGLEGVQGSNTLETLSLTVEFSLRGMMLPHCYFNSWDSLDELLLRDHQAMFPRLREVTISLKFTSQSAQIFLDTYRDSEGEPSFLGYRFRRMTAMSTMCDPPIQCKIAVYGQKGQQVARVPNHTGKKVQHDTKHWLLRFLPF